MLKARVPDTSGNRQLSIPTFFFSISSKSIWAPRPGSVGAWTRPSRSTVMSWANPYFCISASRRATRTAAVRYQRTFGPGTKR